jgi:phenylalanyl-tRNA synthetase beta chain
MRFSEAWLREIVNPSITTTELVEQLTMAGLEVDAVEPAAAVFSGVVVAEIIATEQHPDADRLKICKVAVGETEPLQIVCGADNARVGLKVPAALIGAVLSGNFKIKKSKLRGQLSFGMLCSTKELGLAEAADGLMELAAEAPVGENIRDYLSLNDNIIEVDLTPNRADCLSIEGIAREVAVLNQLDLKPTAIDIKPLVHQDQLAVKVKADIACPRYLGRLIKNVNASAETPLWMQERLRRSGLRSLGPLVDVTNYVLLELGQPLHAFDAGKLTGDIEVRYAKDGESLPLLNDQEIKLDARTVVIADAQRALAFAGVMGGSETAVSTSTTSVFLECAFFTPETIMGEARRYGLHTDSSHRFERGVDPFLQHRAIERATQLIVDIAGGDVGPITEALNTDAIPDRQPVVLRAQRIKRILGVDMAADEVEAILLRLGLDVEKQQENWLVTPPGFRFDIAIEADLIEELGRIYGYNNLPQTSLNMRSELGEAHEGTLEIDRIKDLLVDRGYQEAITYSFVSQEMQEMIVPDDQFTKLKNPISSDMAVMRTTLWCGLLQAALHNTNRQQPRVKLFENGLRFTHCDGELKQQTMLAGLALGNRFPDQWGESACKLDFFDVKSDIEALFSLAACLPVQFVVEKHTALHPGQSAKILTAEGQTVGWLGMLHPSLEKQLGFDSQVFVFELQQELLQKRRVPSFQVLSKFPSVRRDLALLVTEKTTASEIINCIDNCQETRIKDVQIFDIYRGKGVEAGLKSIALGLILQDSIQTLTDHEIDAIVSRVLEVLNQQINARLRD